MTELEKIALAKACVDHLANGTNPLTGQPVPESDVVNHVRVSRCLFYVSDLLRQVMEQGGLSSRKGTQHLVPFRLDYEARAAFRYSDAPITISEITRRINELIPGETMAKLNYKYILDWLTEAGLLMLQSDADGKVIRRPTVSGSQVGIAVEQRQSARGPYSVIVYDRAAQQFILDNLDAAIERIPPSKKTQQ